MREYRDSIPRTERVAGHTGDHSTRFTHTHIRKRSVEQCDLAREGWRRVYGGCRCIAYTLCERNAFTCKRPTQHNYVVAIEDAAQMVEGDAWCGRGKGAESRFVEANAGRRSLRAHLVAVLQQDLLALPLHKLNEGDEKHQWRGHIPEVILHE